MRHLKYTPEERDKDILTLGHIKTAVQNGHRMEAVELIDTLISKIKTLQLVRHEHNSPVKETKDPESSGGDSEPTESVGDGTEEVEAEDISPQSGSEQAKQGEKSYYEESESDEEDSEGSEEE